MLRALKALQARGVERNYVQFQAPCDNDSSVCVLLLTISARTQKYLKPKIMAFQAVFGGLGSLFYILLESGTTLPQICHGFMSATTMYTLIKYPRRT